MALKLDMAKAFDRVEWNFVDEVLEKLGFDPLFIFWIMKCITTASVSFNINGSCSGYVLPSRGIRQGNPLSPYLFLLVSQSLSSIIKQAATQGTFKGLKICKQALNITHLFFADDSLFFCKADVQQILEVKRILAIYGAASGQLVNFEKSSIFFSKNTPVSDREAICLELNGIKEQHKAKYLGLPLNIGRSKKEAFEFVVNASRKKVTN